jgi:glycine oxidase
LTAAPDDRFDLAVIGAGTIGLSIAWRAAQRGLRVVVHERDTIGSGASHVAAGMLAPVTEATFGEERLTALGLAAAARWPAFAEDLRAAGTDPGLRAHGTLVVARDRDEAEALDREIDFRRASGLRVERLRGSEARRMEPALAPAVRLACHAPDELAVDPRVLLVALAKAARDAGAEIREGSAIDDPAALPVDTVVMAAGSWSGGAVRPVKGQVLRLRDPEGPGLLSRNLRMDTGRRSGYLVPRGDGNYVLGATMEERGFDTSITAGALHDLVHDAAELLPGVLELEITEQVAGLRPGTPDNGPIVGRDDAGLVWATGHYRNGILLTPITSDAVLAVLTGEDVPAELAGFGPDRFAKVPA